MCIFLLQSGTLRDIGLVHCGIWDLCIIGFVRWIYWSDTLQSGPRRSDSIWYCSMVFIWQQDGVMRFWYMSRWALPLELARIFVLTFTTFLMNLTITFHYNGVAWEPWCLKSPATRLLVQGVQGDIKENATGGFPLQRASNMESISMSLRYHVSPYFTLYPPCPTQSHTLMSLMQTSLLTLLVTHH